MRQAVVPSQYLQIALDLATRIAQGELTEGSRIYGRSVLASEYGVSPETIRKALRLLADMKVVDVKPQSGAVVLSADSARRYIENFSEDADIHSLRTEHRRFKILAVHRRHHRGHPAGPDGDPLPRSLCRTVQRRRHHPGGKPQRRRGRPPASNDKGVKAAI